MGDYEKNATSNPSGDSAATAIALGGAAADGNLDPRAAAFLEEQTRLAKLQSEFARLQSQNLIEQNAFELSHLRWRRFNDQMRGALQIMIVLLGAVVVVAIATAMWNASQADGLVVEPFTVPPQIALTGPGGDVVADDLTNKVSAIRDIANGNSIDVSKEVRKDRDEDIKVEIPETGVSLAQAWRYLRVWLGHERRVSGNLRDSGDGRIDLTVALDGANAFALSGPRGDIPKLEQQAAEKLFASIDPVNYVLYLQGEGRAQEAIAAASRAVQVVSTPIDRADAYSLFSDLTRVIRGDPVLASTLDRIAIAIDPNIMAAHRELMRNASLLGHDEDALKWARELPDFRREDQPLSQQGAGFDQLTDEGEQLRDQATGDFARGLATLCKACTWADRTLLEAQYAGRLHDLANARRLRDEALATGPDEKTFSGISGYDIDMAAGDWRAAATDIESYKADFQTDKQLGPAYVALRIRISLAPKHALALAHLGAFTLADAEIGQAPDDCVPCATARGEIAALEKNVPVAASWFARAERDGPSLPFADEAWGRMLLHRGDLDGAIAKFDAAHIKGPHFADPLEEWGEALIAKNRSDLAIAKFEEANRYAPNWGRLHLKWGEALRWSGHETEAPAQVAQAGRLELTPEENKVLRTWLKSPPSP